MPGDLYRVVFRGEVRPGLDSEQVRAAVRTLLRCDETMSNRLFSGRPMVIRDSTDRQTALKCQNLFGQTGAVCHIETVTALPQGSGQPSLLAQDNSADMTCPKCGLKQPAVSSCIGCGVVMEKYRRRQAFLGSGESPGGAAAVAPIASGHYAGGEFVAASPERINPRVFFEELFFPTAGLDEPLAIGLKGAVLMVLLIWGGRFIMAPIASNYSGESFLHLINLPFHEAGHVIFRPLGRFMTTLGGSLNQILVPLICLAALLFKTRDAFGAAVCLWWTGENFIDLAPYIDDARAGVLPLLGGNTGQGSPYGFHDWEYLLTETGLLTYDHALARSTHFFGAILMGLAIVWAALVLYRQYRSRQR